MNESKEHTGQTCPIRGGVRWPAFPDIALIFLASFYIIGSSYVGLNGAHMFRQADSYSQILGFLAEKDLNPFDRFFGEPALYDMPIYQYVVASISRLTNSDPLVTAKYFNMACWVGMLFSGGRIAEKFAPGSSLFFGIFITTSSLLLHYFSTPLPDNLAIAVGLAGTMLLLNKGGRRADSVAISALSLVAFIKSPVAFVFVVFYGSYVLINLGLSAVASRRNIALCVLLPTCAVGAEQIRKHFMDRDIQGFANGPTWYFGTLDQRFSGQTWQRIAERLFEAGTFRFVTVVAVIFIVFDLVTGGRQSAKAIAPFGIAFFAGWLTFSNLYLIHDYYQMPAMILFYIASGISITKVVCIAWRYFAQRRKEPRSSTAFRIDRVVPITLIAGASIALLIQPKLSQFSAESVDDAARYFLRDVKVFLWVSDENRDEPIIGGRFKTRFEGVGSSAFEAKCETFISQYNAIVVEGTSACLNKRRDEAKVFFEDDGLQFFLRN